MKRIEHYIPDEGETTIGAVEQVNRRIERGDSDEDVLHSALTQLFGIVGQLEAHIKRSQ
ncbi:MAG: hypothetical protein NTW76_13805 [Corynebacteriales bacterium]|nr:hypothetical protein [Mycobacteriales bacterium]